MTEPLVRSGPAQRRESLWERYGEFLPDPGPRPTLTLGEGGTPLVPLPRLGAAIGVPRLHAKVEGMNPTGSFKDRGMVVAVARAVAAGSAALIFASTGDTSAPPAADAGGG